MSRSLKLFVAAGAAAIVAGTIAAQEQPSPAQRAHEAREHQMYLHAFNLGHIGPMAQGEADYDADVAQQAADNIAALAQMLGSDLYWVPGSSSEDLEESRALPAIWEKPEEFQASITTFQEAAANLQSAAGTDLASLQGALGPLGQACGSCHESFRKPEDE